MHNQAIEKDPSTHIWTFSALDRGLTGNGEGQTESYVVAPTGSEHKERVPAMCVLGVPINSVWRGLAKGLDLVTSEQKADDTSLVTSIVYGQYRYYHEGWVGEGRHDTSQGWTGGTAGQKQYGAGATSGIIR